MFPMKRTAAILIGIAALLAVSACGPKANAKFDYQIGQDYPPPAGVKVVSRDWFEGTALVNKYSICYVNAFQTQADDPWVDRPDERSNWPQHLVLSGLGDDPNWGGEYLIDISTAAKRAAALAWVKPMIDECAAKGFQAVEFDNLDSWTRFDGTPLAGQVPFGPTEAAAYATGLAHHAHTRFLAAGQKNTVELLDQADEIGFDFVMIEQCGVYDECEDFAAVYDKVIAVEYTQAGFAAACTSIGATASVVRRDVILSAPGSGTYIYNEC